MVHKLHRCLDDAQGLSHDGLRARDKRGTAGDMCKRAASPPRLLDGETQDGEQTYMQPDEPCMYVHMSRS